MQARTPKELADSVRNWMPAECQVQNTKSLIEAKDSLKELERIATEKVSPFVINLPETFQNALATLAGRYGVHVTIGKIDSAGPCLGFRFLKPEELARDGGSWSHKVWDDGRCETEDLTKIAAINGFDLLPKLTPAESCAEAVERFRAALEALAHRHGVEVEVGGISPGATCSGITDLPEPSEAELEESCSAERERGAWDKIEAWIDRAPLGSARSVEFRKPRQRHDDFKYSIIFDQRDSHVRMCDGVRSRGVVRGAEIDRFLG